MSGIFDVDVQTLHEKYHSAYFIRISAADLETLSFALRFPFYKVYALAHDRKQVERARAYFENNNRIQIFHRTHDGSFFEIVRMVPSSYSSIFLLDDGGEATQRQLPLIASARPSRRDIMLINGDAATLPATLDNVGRCFGYTHSVEYVANSTMILVLPNRPKRHFDSYGGADSA